MPARSKPAACAVQTASRSIISFFVLKKTLVIRRDIPVKRPSIRSVMNIREVLQARHYSREITRVVKYVGTDPERFSELMKVFFGKDERPAQRAAWALNFCSERHPELVKPYLTK